MKILPVSTLKVNNHPVKYKTFSNYAQRYIKSQMQSVSFKFERFFEDFKGADYTQNVKSENIISDKFIKTKEEGLDILGEDFNYHIFSTQNDSLQIELIDKQNNQIKHGVLLNKNSNDYTYAGDISDSKTEDFISEILDDIDSKFIDLKQKLSPKTPKPYIPSQTTSEKIAELNRTLHTVPRSGGIKNFGLIDSDDMQMLENIIEQYRHIKALYKKIPNDASRYHVRSYYKNYVNPKTGKSSMPFKDIGPMGEPVSVSYITHRNRPYVILNTTDINNKELTYIISVSKGTVQRNLPYRAKKYGNVTKRKDSIPDYLTQEEINKSNLYAYLSCVNRELKLFAEHTQKWLDTQEYNKKYYSNTNVASTAHLNPIIEDISKNFFEYKKKVLKNIPKLAERKQFKLDNGISPELSTSAVTFKNITSNRNDLRLSFPILPDKIATQVLLMNGEKVLKSFYILDDKLLKIDIKKKSDRFLHYNRKMYFHDEEYFNNSNLPAYLELIQNKLHQLNEKLDIIRQNKRRK